MHPAVLLSVEHPTNVPAQTRNQEMGLHFVLSRRHRKLTSLKALRIGRGSAFLNIKIFGLGLLANRHPHDKYR